MSEEESQPSMYTSRNTSSGDTLTKGIARKG